MATNDPSTLEPLAAQKLSAEIEKLRTENKKLQESAWRSPTVLIAACGLALSILGNFVQHGSASTAEAASTRQMQLAEEKWSEEREKLRAELNVFLAKATNGSQDRAKIQAELEKVNRDIAVWDAALFEDSRQLFGMKAELSRQEASKNPAMAEVTKKIAEVDKRNIAIQQDAMRMKTEERNGALARRSELEKRLAN